MHCPKSISFVSTICLASLPHQSMISLPHSHRHCLFYSLSKGSNSSLSSGKISSTNYPKSNYTASRNCTWKITAPVDKKIQFEFTDFALSECSASPCSDSCSYVELYDGGSTGSPLLGRFCQGSPRNELQFSTGNQLSVMFNLGQTVARGFEAEFSTETKATNETTTSTESKIRTDSKMATTTSCKYSVNFLCTEYSRLIRRLF